MELLSFEDFKNKNVIIGNVNDKLITTKVLDKIKEFVNYNAGLIKLYSEEKIKTHIFLKLLKKPKRVIKPKNNSSLLEFYDHERLFNNTITTLSDEERYDSNLVELVEDTTGIKNVIMYCGENPHANFSRIKISNNYDYSNKSDLFTILIPEMEIIGDINTEYITYEILEQIFHFLKLNMVAILKYSKNEIDTGDFITKMIKKIN